MDLLEYQGKQLFERHGIPVPTGRPATTVDEAVEAAEEVVVQTCRFNYMCMLMVLALGACVQVESLCCCLIVNLLSYSSVFG